jgi:hypothetical protein
MSLAEVAAPEELRAPLEMHDVAIRLERGVVDLAACARALAAAGINIDAVQCPAFTGPGWCRLLVEDAEPALRALAAAGIGSVESRPVLVYMLPNRPGTLARYTQALLDHGVALDFLYQATGKGVVIGAPDLDAVRHAFAAA